MAQYGFSTDGKTIVSDFSSEVKDRTFLITGPSEGGIGAETAISLAHASPATIILVGRTISKIQSTIDAIKTIDPSVRTIFIPVELSSLSSVRTAANKILSDSSIPKIDVMINNAAIMACPYSLSEDGYELQFATNYLSHFLLTNLLMPKLILSPSPRVVNVSSMGHEFSGVLPDPGFNSGASYSPWVAYGQSKTGNILFTVNINRKLKSKGVKSFALHPGSIVSGLQKYIDEESRQAALARLASSGRAPPERKTLQQGCSTTLRAALDPNLKQEEQYYDNCQPSAAQPWALDPKEADRVWALSEEMVGQKFEY
ncbi:hypothetical protein B7494_g6332 [Chlorociboria aeruginascens]|nr:hypothetical protein B7494_g6332 [Chlorociboria aeruginascens]